jgi:ribosomal-protein-alanine N-acetyltransferase
LVRLARIYSDGNKNLLKLTVYGLRNGENTMTHKGTVTLETERLKLRRFELADAEALFRNWASDPEVARYMTWLPHDSVSQTRNLLSDWTANYDSFTCYNWAIVPKNFGEPIGNISVTGINERKREAGVGYSIGKAWWHRGYMSEVLSKVISFLFEEIGINRIYAMYDPQNPNSGAVMSKCGMQYEGYLRQAQTNGADELCDRIQYAILAEDYFGKSTYQSQGYIMDLRRYIGHQPIICAVAGVVAENSAGQILLQLRRDNNCWGDAGGALELGESVEDAAKRELFEETGLTANSLELLGVFSGEGMRYTYPNGDIVENVATMFVCRNFSGELKPQESEVTELHWFDIDALPENISPPVVRTINAYLAKHRQTAKPI